ncbi:STAS domain-containing protein [Gemmata sp. JC717]|uniref:STAS domain-containing protein n=1 Tax=Gemmata algarum TaxID=2975278 RepID=A0ABU5EVD6_9BACT|nr:STAS domain-containing protein [Gemmata algarum]MDY3552884.1 STAS domain-containing protein [Gemmata algarum]MDY3559263.1 STAS domain-containing protein [Gemmata algarum]
MAGASPVRVTDDERPGWARLVLAGRVTVADAHPLHAAAREALARGTNVAVRCDEVEHLDAAAIQVLLCLSREVRRAGRQLVVGGVPGPITEYLRLAGLAGQPAA